MISAERAVSITLNSLDSVYVPEEIEAIISAMVEENATAGFRQCALKITHPLDTPLTKEHKWIQENLKVLTSWLRSLGYQVQIIEGNDQFYMLITW